MIESDLTSTASPNSVTRIAVIGGGLTGWMTAALLAQRLSPKVNITLVELEKERDSIAGVECTLPAISGYHAQLGLSDSMLVRADIARPTLAVHYPDADYYLAFEAPGFTLDRVPFHHYAQRLYQNGESTPFDAYSLAAQAARQNRYHPKSDNPTSLFATLNAGLQLNVEGYTNAIANLAKNRGVQAIANELVSVSVHQNQIQGINLASGQVISADLFIDATGTSACVIDALKVPYEPLQSASGLTRVTESAQNSTLNHRIELTDTGWVIRRSAPGVTATRRIEQRDREAGDRTGTEMVMGRRLEPWTGNVIAVGEAAAMLEGFVTDPLHWVQSAIIRLLEAFPSATDWESTRKEYNRRTELEWQSRQNFFELHCYLASLQKPDSHYWQNLWQSVDNPELKRQLALFKASGVTATSEARALPECLWVSLLLGHGLWPETCDPLVSAKPLPWIEEQLTRMRDLIGRATMAMKKLQ